MDISFSAAGNDNAGLMPTPEDVFLTWVFSLPSGIDLPQAARMEIARIDDAGRDCVGLLRLRGLLQQATANAAQPAVRRHRRVRH